MADWDSMAPVPQELALSTASKANFKNEPRCTFYNPDFQKYSITKYLAELWFKNTQSILSNTWPNFWSLNKISKSLMRVWKSWLSIQKAIHALSQSTNVQNWSNGHSVLSLSLNYLTFIEMKWSWLQNLNSGNKSGKLCMFQYILILVKI